MCLRLQDYQFVVKYRPGPKNPSDYLSRHPVLRTTTTDDFVEQYVNFIAANDIRKATREDTTLQQLIKIIQNNSWHILNDPQMLPKDCDEEELLRLSKIQEELSITTDAETQKLKWL